MHPTGGRRHTQKKRPIDSGADSSQASARRVSVEGEQGDFQTSGVAHSTHTEKNTQAFEISFELPPKEVYNGLWNPQKPMR